MREAVDAAGEACRPLKPTPAQLAARRGVMANDNERREHTTLLRRLMRKNPDEGALDGFDAHRIRPLRRFNPSQDDVDADRAMLNYLVKAPWPVRGYAYAANGEPGQIGAFDIEFPLPGEDTTDGALERLIEKNKEEKGEPRFDVVSLDRARFGQVAAIPAVRERFARMGFELEHPEKATYFYTPYAFVSEFLGALGEEAGAAIFESVLGDELLLSRGAPDKAERGGDYEVIDADGRETGVWIDFKHYAMAGYLRRGPDADEAERFEEKAEAVSASALIVVNLLADDAAAGLAPRALLDGLVWTVPYLVRDGKVDARAMMTLKGLIDARKTIG